MTAALAIEKKLPPWLQLTYVLAKQLQKTNAADTFLTQDEAEYFNQSLGSFQHWCRFIQPDPALDSKPHLNQDQMAAFRVRAMLCEQFIPHFFHSDRPCCRKLKLDLNQLSLEANELNEVAATVATLSITSNSPKPTIKNEQEPFEEQTQEEEQPPSQRNTDHVPLLDIYHTLEFDMAAMIEQRKLEAYHAQEEAHEHEKEDIDTTRMIIGDTDQFSLKHLLKGIAENRSKTSLSDRDLRNLLSEIKPHRSKWANDDRIGQEELYEACEKVLTDLKNYTEHSTPFLNKVSKREAPDYFEVIKNPMDLGTVSKKLKQFQYKSKADLAKDLYLIYENCLIYNTDPSSEYRKHAIAMRRKTDRLLSRVPDIVIKERHDHDMDEDHMDDVSDDDSISPIKSLGKHRERTNSISRASRERSMTRESLDESPILHVNYSGKYPQKGVASKPTGEINAIDEELTMNNEIDTDKGELQNQLWREITKKTRGKATTDIEKQYQFDFGNRHAITQSSVDIERCSLLERLHHQPESTKKLIRCSRLAFLRWLDRHDGIDMSIYDRLDMNSEDEEGFDGGFFFSRNDKPKPTDEDDALRTDLFLPEYAAILGLPEFEGVPEEMIEPEDSDLEEDNLIQNIDKNMPSLDAYPTTQPPQHGIGALLDQNIQTLGKIRSMYSKCNAVCNNTPILSAPITEASPTPDTPIPSSTCHPPLIIDEDAAQQMMQRTIIQLLTHAGFEGSHTMPLGIITELVAERFSNIGKTIRNYWDEYNHIMTGEEILLHTLHENGVNQLDDLEVYITDDVERHGDRLNGVVRKLEGAYRDIINASTEDTVQDESNLFEDQESFITGSFGSELGHDFFGLKDLGLDQELGACTLEIPSKLWFGNDRQKLSIHARKPKEPVVKYPIPPSFSAITSEKSFIGLLQPWYRKRLQEEPDAIEDEYIKRRPYRSRYPPVHIRSANPQMHSLTTAAQSTGRRRALKDGSNTIHASLTEEMKKKRKQMNEEAKAERKKYKLEQKVQKIADKELKKKQREESREKEKPVKQQKEKKQAL